MTTFAELPDQAVFVRINHDRSEVLRVKTGTFASKIITMVTPGERDLILARGTDPEQPDQLVQPIDYAEELKVAS